MPPPPPPPTIPRALTVQVRTGRACVHCREAVAAATVPFAVHDMFGNRWKVRCCAGCAAAGELSS
ncbi:hypothetical protein [Allostreptomyces psammosilenae]|uniref:Uncharacterized protein n=1 Tax=Allostreptomyces psammosilenae TaxID=1892865 RepID=A0A852ZW56_9ACTN|nr:hypothetical protein [Allostreptomyces psammosilenae]NYI06185.1 hypothetical protein [Allostreptomyces psammosilenae]